MWCKPWQHLHSIFLSWKLASATGSRTRSWSSSCFSKVLGGWNLQSRETSQLTTPNRRLAGSQAVWPWLNPPWGHRRHVATGSKFGSIRILRMSVFSCQAPCQAPCQASSRPLPLGLKLNKLKYFLKSSYIVLHCFTSLFYVRHSEAATSRAPFRAWRCCQRKSSDWVGSHDGQSAGWAKLGKATPW